MARSQNVCPLKYTRSRKLNTSFENDCCCCCCCRFVLFLITIIQKRPVLQVNKVQVIYWWYMYCCCRITHVCTRLLRILPHKNNASAICWKIMLQERLCWDVARKAVFGFQYPLLIKITRFTYNSSPACVSFVHLSCFISNGFAKVWHHNNIPQGQKLSDTDRGRVFARLAEGITFTFVCWMWQKMCVCSKWS